MPVVSHPHVFSSQDSNTSDTSSITIHRQKPEMSLQHFPGEYVSFICSLPGSADRDTTCNLYFGESSHPVQTKTIWKKRNSKNQWICQFTVTTEDLLRRLRSVQQSDASCDYTLRSEPNSLSPRSHGYSLTDIVKKESSFTQTMSTLSMTTGLTVDRSDASTSAGWPVGTHSSTVVSTSTSPTPVKPASETDTSLTSMNPESGDEISGVTVYRSGASTPIKLTSAGWPVGTHSSTVGSTSTSPTPVKPASGSSVSTPSTKDRETAASSEYM
ncbi:A-agglutinin anchorage subunit-like [Larimichthys crocea]|uniref:A-agglutinin anchorage subunit-like n=1 Tax=Larimichthys crocea TaxID=215358 RepID=UPI000F5E5B5A|nr:A-agglutinin anchorage subunit-like [Larimichthys crocea]